MPTTCHCVATTPPDSGGKPSRPAGGSPSPVPATGAAEPSPTTPTGNASPSTSSCWGAAPVASLLLWVRSCFLRLDNTTKDFPQALQWKGRSPECMRLCLVRLARSAKARPHSSQRNGRCPECTNACRLRSQEATKVLSHCRHLKGRSPVCTRRCMARSAGCFTPSWARWWRRKLEGSENMRPQRGHRKGFSPECVRSWLW
ncbi:unknown_gene_1299 [Phodopus roborovskii]|uniref:Unknown_gene_1299 protein n=1 Tax=Phodopus roborovskii TaxID=109678 RepID=A0AAU9ZMG6_PHORO|nr:unknown_gene_1299 [Phodopus roborovskii]